MTLTLVGDVFLGGFLTLIADRSGRRKVLIGGSLLMVMSGTVFAFVENFWILLIAAVLGVISTTGGDFGPFRSIEESVLTPALLKSSNTLIFDLGLYYRTSRHPKQGPMYWPGMLPPQPLAPPLAAKCLAGSSTLFKKKDGAWPTPITFCSCRTQQWA